MKTLDQIKEEFDKELIEAFLKRQKEHEAEMKKFNGVVIHVDFKAKKVIKT